MSERDTPSNVAQLRDFMTKREAPSEPEEEFRRIHVRDEVTGKVFQLRVPIEYMDEE